MKSQIMIMKHLSVLIILIIISLIKIILSDNYFCNLRCNTNTAPCYRSPCPPSEVCGANFSAFKLNKHDRNYILQLNNKFRSSISEGVYHQLRSASDMIQLMYDKELEFTAQCWANNCRAIYDICVTTDKFEHVSQNIAKFKINDDAKARDIITVAYLKTWLPEVSLLGRDYLNLAMLSRLYDTRAVLNILCSKTTHVGCGIVKFGNEFISALIICNYGPDECRNHDPFYKEGDTDTNCKYGVSEHGLCLAPPRYRRKHTWKPPFRIKTTSSAFRIWSKYSCAFSFGLTILFNGD